MKYAILGRLSSHWFYGLRCPLQGTVSRSTYLFFRVFIGQQALFRLCSVYRMVCRTVVEQQYSVAVAAVARLAPAAAAAPAPAAVAYSACDSGSSSCIRSKTSSECSEGSTSTTAEAFSALAQQHSRSNISSNSISSTIAKTSVSGKAQSLWAAGDKALMSGVSDMVIEL